MDNRVGWERSLQIDYSELNIGQIVSERTYKLDGKLVAEYTAAVQDVSEPLKSIQGKPLAPPMSVAALSLRGVVNDLQIPGGTLHVGQEFQFKEAVSVGTTLVCQASISQNSVRAGMRFLVVNLTVQDVYGIDVMAGKSTIMLPEVSDSKDDN